MKYKCINKYKKLFYDTMSINKLYKGSNNMRTKSLIVKVTENEQKLIKERAEALGFDSVSDYIRYIALNTESIKRSISK